MRITLSARTMKEIIDLLVAEDAILDGAKLGLIKNETPLVPGTPFAALEFANWTGYAHSAAVEYHTIHTDPDGNRIVQIAPVEFTGGPTETEVVVTQVVLLNAAADDWLASYTLEQPLSFTSSEDVYLIGFPVYVSQPGETSEEPLP